MKSVYQAGPIQHLDDNGRTWRDMLKEDHPEFEWLDPLDKYDTANENMVFYSEVTNGDGEKYELSEGVMEEQGPQMFVRPVDIVENDKNMIDDSDAMFVGWVETPSCGTPMEVMYQYMINHLHPHREEKPIVVWWIDGEESEGHISPWMEFHADSIHFTLEGALEALRESLKVDKPAKQKV